MSRELQKFRSRYGDTRYETILEGGWVVLEGLSPFIRCAELDRNQKKLALTQASLGMVDFEGGPYVEVGGTYLPFALPWVYPDPDISMPIVTGIYPLSSKNNYHVFAIALGAADMTQFDSVTHPKNSPVKEALPLVLKDPMADLLETLADLEHQQWMDWANTLMAKEPNLTPERIERWKKCMVPYSELTEEMKEFDRIWARKILKALIDALALSDIQELHKNNTLLTEISDSLRDEIEELHTSTAEVIQNLETTNQELQSSIEDLRKDVVKLFGAGVDKKILERYLSSKELENG